mmetsp:Transcript_19528/g.31997  ORF Transcript_19528/g.31997 Transcript_19528/m.31997 type:complete len:226 (+) Transcript_19528:929-1606(+)
MAAITHPRHRSITSRRMMRLRKSLATLKMAARSLRVNWRTERMSLKCIVVVSGPSAADDSSRWGIRPVGRRLRFLASSISGLIDNSKWSGTLGSGSLIRGGSSGGDWGRCDMGEEARPEGVGGRRGALEDGVEGTYWDASGPLVATKPREGGDSGGAGGHLFSLRTSRPKPGGTSTLPSRYASSPRSTTRRTMPVTFFPANGVQPQREYRGTLPISQVSSRSISM